ncbi:MAG: hypothetical protein NC548_53260 [Lachnospiraceae bacterium]|nr:hypothetical protein [Lachnospiraceae bacterium]MCM1234883.1 hypothetical protein [Ruminococcus flavefaciens]
MKRVVISSNGARGRRIMAAEEKEDTRVQDMSDGLKDDFDYALDGFDKMVRNGKVAEALSIMTTLSDALNAAISATAAEIS